MGTKRTTKTSKVKLNHEGGFLAVVSVGALGTLAFGVLTGLQSLRESGHATLSNSILVIGLVTMVYLHGALTLKPRA